MKQKKSASKYCLHPWHGVDPGPNPPSVVNAVIEVPSNSKAKFEVHKSSGMLMLDRYLDSAAFYPANYGFIPQTYCDDNDPLDILVFSQTSVPPLTIMTVCVIYWQIVETKLYYYYYY